MSGKWNIKGAECLETGVLWSRVSEEWSVREWSIMGWSVMGRGVLWSGVSGVCVCGVRGVAC